MSTITKEWLQQKIADMEAARDEIPFGLGEDGTNTLAALRIALASIEAEPALYAAEETLAYAKHGELHMTCLSEPMGDAVIPLYAIHPAQRTPDMTDFRPCPFCNSPVKWCGENSADPEDDHACHHIQCTNPECGADFDFTNTGDDLLPDDPETLDAMTAAECLQPLRNVCLNRFNSRAAMLQGAEPVTTDYKLPEGWVAVPIEPTAEMLQSGISAHYERSQIHIHDRPAPGPMECAYAAMLAAAPQQEVKP